MRIYITVVPTNFRPVQLTTVNNCMCELCLHVSLNHIASQLYYNYIAIYIQNNQLHILFQFIATDCSLEVKDVQPISVSLGDKLVVVCPPNNPCSGEYVIEHLNHSTSQYEIIQSQIIQQEANRANVTIRKLSNAGYFRCSKRCNDGESDSPHCYFNAVGKLQIFNL